MSKIEEVKKIMGFSENFHMCDVSEIEEDHIHLERMDMIYPVFNCLKFLIRKYSVSEI